MNINLFTLELSYCNNDIKCKKCEANFYVKWTTKYGDAVIGEHTCKCLNCNETIKFDVYIQYINY